MMAESGEPLLGMPSDWRAMGYDKSLAQRAAHWQSAPKLPTFGAVTELLFLSYKYPARKGYRALFAAHPSASALRLGGGRMTLHDYIRTFKQRTDTRPAAAPTPAPPVPHRRSPPGQLKL